MSSESVIYFVIAAGLFIAIPGPNVLVIVATSLSHGTRRGLQTVAGTSSAMVIQLSVAALATAGFINLLAQGFIWLKWLGVFYLLYLACTHLLSAFRNTHQAAAITGSGSFIRGFYVSLTNPKTIVFFAAFLPQFINPEAEPLAQLGILSAIFVCLATVLDSCYVLLAGRLKRRLSEAALQRWASGVAGMVYLLASGWIAVSRRSA